MTRSSDTPRILIFAPHCLAGSSRSGIHRVAIRLTEHLPRHARVDLVKWDDVEGQLRFYDKNDLKRFFGGRVPAGIKVHRFAHRVAHKFADAIDKRENVIVLMPEPFYLAENGNEIHARLIAQCLVAGWTTAAIFYDIIPLKNAGYTERDASARSVAELLRVVSSCRYHTFLARSFKAICPTRSGSTARL